jgi:hypothetical protein
MPDPDLLRSKQNCLAALSKNMEGQALVVEANRRRCQTPACESLTLVQHLRLKLSTYACDSPQGLLLEGSIVIRDLTTVFGGGRPQLRGVHAGRFYWTPSGGGRIVGSIEGVTNAGLVRSPSSPNAEVCDRQGVLTGHLSGTGKNVPQVPVSEFTVEAVYRIDWTPDETVQSTTAVTGTLEGVLILPCR